MPSARRHHCGNRGNYAPVPATVPITTSSAARTIHHKGPGPHSPQFKSSRSLASVLFRSSR